MFKTSRQALPFAVGTLSKIESWTELLILLQYPPPVLMLTARCRNNRAFLFSPLVLALSFRVELTATLDGKLGIVGSHRYLFNFRQVGKAVAKRVERPAGRFVFSRFSQKKDDGSRLRRSGERETERREKEMRASCARARDPTSSSYLRHEIAGNCVSVCQDDFSSCPLGTVLLFQPLHRWPIAFHAFSRWSRERKI